MVDGLWSMAQKGVIGNHYWTFQPTMNGERPSTVDGFYASSQFVLSTNVGGS